MRRPVDGQGGRAFDLHYVRMGPSSTVPVLIVPGGPGIASVRPYRSLRASAGRQGLAVIMVEHRGVGLSRCDDDGVDLPQSALTIEAAVDDLAAVLDDCGVEQAVVYGASYGSYLAQAFGVRHPDRVAGMVLDSPLLRADRGSAARDNLRRLFWDGGDPQTAALASTVRSLVATGAVPAHEVAPVLQVAYELAGPARMQQLLDLVATGGGRRTWRWVHGSTRGQMARRVRYIMEFDLVGAILFRQLGFAPVPDGGPLDLNLDLLPVAETFPPFEGEPYDLPRALPDFHWPTAVISGERDLRTPPTVAREVVDLLPDAVLVPLTDHGHSALDAHPHAALAVACAVVRGVHRDLPARAQQISALDKPRSSNVVDGILAVWLTAARLLPRRRSP